MKNIYFVESPLQLLSAIDAANNFSGENFLYVKKAAKKNKKNNEQMGLLIHKVDWDSVVTIPFFSNKFILHLWLFFFTIYLSMKFQSKKTNVYIGDFRSFYFNIFSRVISPKKEILLDDGAAVIALQKLFFQNGVNFEEYLKSRDKKFLKLYHFYNSIFRFKNISYSPPHLYSVFELDEFLHIKQSNYRKKSGKMVGELLDKVFFFGAKYSESGLISLDHEILLLEKAYCTLKEKSNNIYYVTHRDDSESKIAMVSQVGYMILELNMPAELYFEAETSLPKYIAGFWTTVLYSLSSSHSFDEVISFDISAHLKDENLRGEISSIYEEYSNVGMKLIEIPE